MKKTVKKCEKCGVELKPSQYARKLKKDGTALKEADSLICRNYPECVKAEKDCEITLKK